MFEFENLIKDIDKYIYGYIVLYNSSLKYLFNYNYKQQNNDIYTVICFKKFNRQNKNQ